MFAATKTFASIVNRRQAEPQAGEMTALLLDRLAHGGALSGPEQAVGGSVFNGTLSLAELRAGFFLHRTDIAYLRGLTSRFPLTKSGIKIVLKLQGGGRLRIGPLVLPVEVPPGGGARAAVVALRGPAPYEHRCRAPSRERMLVLTLAPHWLDKAGLGHLNALPHLTMTAWAPSPRAVCVAEQLLAEGQLQDGPLSGLQQECLTLELVIEALAQWVAPANSAAACEAAGLRPTAYQRACHLRDWLDSGAADSLTMGAIARHMGCNASTLQTQFRQAFGKPIFEHLREGRLRRAADAITAQGITVAQAADLAGYRSPANFSTAFRRLYGFSPKNLRAKR